jgi:hypothetical protein
MLTLPIIGPIISGIMTIIQLIQLFRAILDLIGLLRKSDPSFNAAAAAAEIKAAKQNLADAKAGNPHDLEGQFSRLKSRVTPAGGADRPFR